MSYIGDYGRDVANIYQNLGDAQARARLQQGQGWANALGQIGQSVSQIPQQMQQQKDAEQQRLDAQQGRDARSLQMQNTQGEMDARKADAASKAEEEKRRKMVLAIGAGLSNGDPGIMKASLDQIAPELRPGVEQYLSEHQKRKMDDIKSQAKLAQALGYPAPVVEVLAAMGGASYLDDYHKATEGGKNPQAIKQMVDKAAALGDAPAPAYTLNPGDRRMSGDDQVVAENPIASKPAEPKASQPDAQFQGPRGEVVFRNPSGPGFVDETGKPMTGVRLRTTQEKSELVPVQDPDGVTRYGPKVEGAVVPGQRGNSLPAAVMSDMADMLTLEKMGDQALAEGERLKWEGVGGAGYGSGAQFFKKNFDWGSQDAQGLRNIISNIKGTIAKLRGGTAFTPNEQAMLEAYTPTIDDSPGLVQSKITSFKNFLQKKRESIGSVYGVDTKDKEDTSKHVSMAELELIAKNRGTTVEQEKQRATAAGYVIR